MLHEVLDASRPAAEVPLQTRPHDAPSQPGAVAHRVVRVLDAQHVLLNQVHDLAVEREVMYLIQQDRSEEHTSELQSRLHLVCRLLLEKKKTKQKEPY